MINSITTTLSLSSKRQYFNDEISRVKIDRRNDTTIYITITTPTELQEDLTSANVTIYFSYRDGVALPPFSLTSIGGSGLDLVTATTNSIQVKGDLMKTTWNGLDANSEHTIMYEVKLSVGGKEMYIGRKKEFYVY